MEPKSLQFHDNVAAALKDAPLQQSLSRFQTGFTVKRAEAKALLPEFEALRDESVAIKNHALANLDHYLLKFEEAVVASGGIVHWCADGAAARETVLRIFREDNVKSATKSKSMISEEIGLNDFLEDNGIEPIETDLGEYIIQLAGETPSHVIAPAVHKTREEVSDLFYKHHQKYGVTKRHEDVPELVDEARQMLRRRFQAADAGITGANFLIAETGSVVVVTNEGNADLTEVLPRTHVVLATIEKVVPTIADASTILRVLARTATGQEFSTYTTFATGPRRADDVDGPAKFHVILLDGGRSELLGSEFKDILRCIKCGACMNHCPVYGSIGGHAYGWVYPGPLGAVLNPGLIGIDEARHLPGASTFCGRCESVCPMRIPLPDLMRRWRERAKEQRLAGWRERRGLAAWSFIARRPALYRPMSRVAARMLRGWSRGRGRLVSFPGASGWTNGRDMPVPEGGTFMAQWAANRDASRPVSGGRP